MKNNEYLKNQINKALRVLYTVFYKCNNIKHLLVHNRQ